MNKLEKEIEKYLLKNKDIENKKFQSRLIPTIDESIILGIKSPVLKRYAKLIYKTTNYKDFLKILPHKYFDENNLHALIIENIKDYDECIEEINRFLPYVNNWATCDSLCPKIVKTNLYDFLKHIKKWIKNKNTYTVRFGIKMLMSFYLDNEFKPEYLKLISSIKFKSKYKYKKINIVECPDKYYVEMMIAWFFATAMAKQPSETLLYIKNKKLNVWTHNMVIKKSCESFRVSDDIKKKIKKYHISS